MNLNQFHHLNSTGTPTGVFDYAIFEFLVKELSMFVLGGIVYIYRDGVYVPDANGSILKTRIKGLIYPQFIRSSSIERIYKLFLMDAGLQKQSDDLNNFPKEWINFQNGFYDPVKQETVPHSPRYYTVNQLPIEYNPSKATTGRHIDEWLAFICPDPEDRQMLLEFLGYCMTVDTRQQKFLILYGQGGTGKSTLIRMLEEIVGSNNICNISLGALSQKFACYGLVGKLVNSCADLEIGALEDTSTLKKILGEDPIMAEAKGKDAFRFKSYAKLIFSANELPIVVGEKTDGFFRRLLVLKMDRKPADKNMDYLSELLGESDYFVSLCMEALHAMYTRGMITESRNSIHAVQALRNDSDTVEAWLSERCSLDPESKIERTALYHNYENYCAMYDRKPLTPYNFYKSLNTKGFVEIKTTVGNCKGVRCIKGIVLGKPEEAEEAEKATKKSE